MRPQSGGGLRFIWCYQQQLQKYASLTIDTQGCSHSNEEGPEPCWQVITDSGFRYVAGCGFPVRIFPCQRKYLCIASYYVPGKVFHKTSLDYRQTYVILRTIRNPVACMLEQRGWIVYESLTSDPPIVPKLLTICKLQGQILDVTEGLPKFLSSPNIIEPVSSRPYQNLIFLTMMAATTARWLDALA